MPERMPLLKLIDQPLLSLDQTSIEMASILFMFVAVMAITGVRWRRQWIRRVVQAVSLLFFFFVVYSCLGVFGLLRNGLYGLTLIGSAYTESFYWMALPAVALASVVVSGPIFCGWICPTGSVQEFFAWVGRPLHRSTQGRRRLLIGLLILTGALVAMGLWMAWRQRLFIEDSSLHWAASLILLCALVVLGRAEDQALRALRWVSVAAITLTAVSHLAITSPVHFAFTARGDPASMVTTVVLALASLFVARSFCRYLCPWGALSGVLNRYARVQLRGADGPCGHDCGNCQSVCDVAAVKQGQVRINTCQMCYACVDACPQGVLEVVDVWMSDANTGDPAGQHSTCDSAAMDQRAGGAQ